MMNAARHRHRQQVLNDDSAVSQSTCVGNSMNKSLYWKIGLCGAICFAIYVAYTRKQTHPGVDELKWWQKSIVYQIYPRSFQDTDGDGVGDLRGITSRLDYISYLNVGAIWLSPIQESPMVDFGYDVSNFTRIAPLFGTMEDFDELVESAHSKGIKIILDFIPNHSSDKHIWFQKSRESVELSNHYKDWYVWHDGMPGLKDGDKPSPPNNWLSFFGGSAWEWDERRKQYYLHQYAKEQPDLNWRNPNVRKAMTECLEFWLDRGVDGIRVDSVFTLYESEDFLDEPRSYDPLATRADEHKYLKHIHTQHLPEVHGIVANWRKLMDVYEEKDGQPRFMVTEVYSENIDHVIEYYKSGADISFNFDLIQLNKSCGGLCLHALVDNLLANLPEAKWPNYVVSNHDNKRISPRIGKNFINAINMMLLLLPGTPTVYYGDELGMEDIFVSYEETQDPLGKFFGPDRYQEYSRDPCRSPMQWDNSLHAGFSKAKKTWLPVQSDYATNNVHSQSGSENSHLLLFRSLTLLRRKDAFLKGTTRYGVLNGNIFSFIRLYGYEKYLVTLNIGHTESEDDYSGAVNAVHGVVVFLTAGGLENNYEVGARINLVNLKLKSGQGLVIKV